MLRSTIAIAQMTSIGDTLSNFECCKNLVYKAVDSGACFIALPECFHFIGNHYTQSIEIAESLNGPTITKYKNLAKESKIWMSLGGFQEKSLDNNKIYNSHIIINSDGDIVDVYRKIHLFDVNIPGGAMLLESKFTKPGNNIIVSKTPFGNLGLSTCYDLRFPELYCDLVYEKGANILLVPSAFTVPTGKAHWEILLRSRAIEMQCYVIASAQVGKHNDKRESYGHSMVISPWGDILVNCKDNTNNGKGLIKTITLDFDYLDKIREKMPCLQHRNKALEKH